MTIGVDNISFAINGVPEPSTVALPGYEKRPTPDGVSIDYLSPKIAHAIDPYCKALTVDESVFADASNEELLSYVAGAYRRFGKGYLGTDGKMHPCVIRKKSLGDVRTLGRVLARLGSKNINIFSAGPRSSPTAYGVTFVATWKFEKAFANIPHRSVDDLGESSLDNPGNVDANSTRTLDQIPSTLTPAQDQEDQRQRIADLKKEPPVWKIDLEPKPQPFLSGQPMNLEIRMTNLSQKTLPLWKKGFDYSIVVTDAKGYRINTTKEGCRVLEPPPFLDLTTLGSYGRYKDIQPSAADTRNVDLSQLFELSAPGKYRVTVKHDSYEPLIDASVDVTVQ